jgi:hypothetical protein
LNEIAPPRQLNRYASSSDSAKQLIILRVKLGMSSDFLKKMAGILQGREGATVTSNIARSLVPLQWPARAVLMYRR